MDENKRIKVLVVAPHHDDEVIGCGGSICVATRMGSKVDVVYMTAGDSCAVVGQTIEDAIAARESESIAAAHLLGVERQFFLRHPDRSLVYEMKYVRQIVTILRTGGYSAFLFPHAGERDREHHVVNLICGEAAWISQTRYFADLGEPVTLRNVMMYEVWTPLSVVSFKQDISGVLTNKIDALACYQSQFSRNQAERIVGLNTYRAAMTSPVMHAAEAFQYYQH